MELFASQDPRSYSLFFDLNIWFRARKGTGTFEKRAPGNKHKTKRADHQRNKDNAERAGY